MNAVFADTFYWIALTSPTDAAHRRAHQVTDDIVTTDEVLSEYLTFFSKAPESLRRQAANNVEWVLKDPSVRVIPQSRDSLLAGLELYGQKRGPKTCQKRDCQKRDRLNFA